MCYKILVFKPTQNPPRKQRDFDELNIPGMKGLQLSVRDGDEESSYTLLNSEHLHESSRGGLGPQELRPQHECAYTPLCPGYRGQGRSEA